MYVHRLETQLKSREFHSTSFDNLEVVVDTTTSYRSLIESV